MKLLGRDVNRLSDSDLVGIDVVSFDVFDTLVYRCCREPRDVFMLVERRYNKALDNAYSIQGFCAARAEAEAIARQKSNKQEVTIREIYNELPAAFQPASEELMAFEIDTEIALCRPIPEIQAFFRRVLDLCKRIIVVSDMYLPSTCIEAILMNCGYSGLERVFVSSEFGITKRQGDLFSLAASQLGTPPNRMLHIGDHPLNDWLSPKHLGMMSFLYRRPIARTRLLRPWTAIGANRKSMNSLELSVIGAIIQEGLRHYCDIREKFGFAVLGPMLYGYCTWLHALKQSTGAEKLWFLAREGYIIRKAYLALYDSESTMARYVHASRTALCRPMAGGTASYEELMSLLSCLANSLSTVGDLFSVLGINKKDDLPRFGLHESSLLSEQDGQSVYRAVLALGGDELEQQRTLALEYLYPSGKPSKTLVCDIGWTGTMQAILQKLLPSEEFVGAYLAVSDFHDSEQSIIDRSVLDRRGFWCDSTNWGDSGQAFRFVQSAAETLFLNSEGTTLGYERLGERVVPVKAENAQLKETEISAGLLHTSAVAFIMECAAARLPDVMGEIDSLSALLPFFNTATRASDKAVKLYRHFKFLDGARIASITPEHGTLYYLLHPRDMIVELETNNSKVLWLKGVFKLPLPYYRILRTLTSGFGMKSSYARGVESRLAEISNG